MSFYTIQGKADAQHQPMKYAVAEYAVVDKSKKKNGKKMSNKM